MKFMFCMAILALVSSAGIAQTAGKKAEKPEYWMMPSPWPDNGGPLKELITRDKEWAKTRGVITGLGYWPALLNVHFSDTEIKQLFTKLKSWNLKFGFEVPVIKKETPTAIDTFAVLETQMKRFKPLGASVQWFAFDEPFYATKHILVKSDAYAVEETAKFITMLRKKYPDARVGDIEPYPVLKLAELESFVTQLNEECGKNGVKGIDFLRLDVDWGSMNNSLSGSWVEVKKLEKFCRANGVAFSLIYWAADYPPLDSLKLADDMTWYLGVMHQGNAYAIVGGRPDEYVMESWVQVPKHAVPEMNPAAFTGAVLDFYNRFLK